MSVYAEIPIMLAVCFTSTSSCVEDHPCWSYHYCACVCVCMCVHVHVLLVNNVGMYTDILICMLLSVTSSHWWLSANAKYVSTLTSCVHTTGGEH